MVLLEVVVSVSDWIVLVKCLVVWDFGELMRVRCDGFVIVCCSSLCVGVDFFCFSLRCCSLVCSWCSLIVFILLNGVCMVFLSVCDVCFLMGVSVSCMMLMMFWMMFLLLRGCCIFVVLVGILCVVSLVLSVVIWCVLCVMIVMWFQWMFLERCYLCRILVMWLNFLQGEGVMNVDIVVLILLGLIGIGGC